MNQHKIKNPGAVALGLCFCVILLTSFLAVKSSIDKIRDMSGLTETVEEQVPLETGEASAETPVVDSREEASASSEFVAPVRGHIQLKYSMDGLVYSKTLDQYMTHPGVDINVPAGSAVSAIADGTITDVYDHDRYGVTLEVTHADGIVSVYSNLDTHGHLEKGDTVEQGQKIGVTGTTAAFEILDSHHLHFEMRKDGDTVDPTEYIDF